MEYAIAFQRLRDVAGGLSRVLTKPEKQPHGHADTALVNALAEEGCPVCRTRSEHDDRYFFWFLHENYGQVEVIEKLVGSHWGSAQPMVRHCSAVWTRLLPSWRSFTRRWRVISSCRARPAPAEKPGLVR